MAEFYIGQVMMTGFAFAPRNFAQCNGQIISIQQNQAVFALLGTTYGGDGINTFKLPDLRSRTPVGAFHNYPIGAIAGAENVTLTPAQMPQHTHAFGAQTAAGSATDPTASVYANALKGAVPLLMYAPAATSNLVPLNSGEIQPAGGAQPHPNLQPFQVINFNIALSGVFPSRN
jgi:microcystin-dependent protein